MTQEYKTLRELDVQPGDVVVNNLHGARPVEVDRIEGGDFWSKLMRMNHGPIWRIVFRASDIPKLWSDMTPEEKGALLLAHHEGKVIERLNALGEWVEAKCPNWFADCAYRVRPEPKRETVTLYGSVTDEAWGRGATGYDTHRITFDLIDGEPDFDSIKMEPL